MNLDGLIIGLASFLIIGIFHPIVIKAEYYFGIKIWPCFLVLGIISGILSVILGNTIVRCILGVGAFTSFWSIKEIFEQRRRVEKGWFPENPARKKK